MVNDAFRFQIPKIQKYLHFLEARVVRETAPVTGLEIVDPAEMRFDAPPDSAPWRPFALEEAWGSRQQWAWFRASLVVPRHWQEGRIRLRLTHRSHFKQRPGDDNWPAGPEGQVFIDGRRMGAIDQQHHVVDFPFKPGHTHALSAVFFAGRCELTHVVEQLDLACADPATEDLYYDLRHALDIIEQLPEGLPQRYLLIDAVEAALRRLDFRQTRDIETPAGHPDLKGETFYPTVAEARRIFSEKRAAIPADQGAPELVAVGHAHIDLAWLWPLKQTFHKCVRTFATQDRLLARYPDWIFFQSQPQAYAWVERDAPDLFAKIGEWIRQGRWEADGAAWVEFDTNVPSGESIVRQLLYGKRYFREKFGVDSRLLWLPDVFGYNGALPQILRLAGVDGFVTSKISWNQYNRFPHDTFMWRGIDGTDIPTHFITTPSSVWYLTYNAMMTVEEIKRNHEEYRQKYLGTDPLMSFGWGDGGGGPTETMLETGGRMANEPAIAGLPRVKFERPAHLLERIAQLGDKLPVWDGELYLEFHRGTYTTQAWLKRANRKNEQALHQLEWLASLGQAEGLKLDKPAVDEMWRDLLLMQFHDILPGSSVGEVYYDEIKPMQARIDAEAQKMIGKLAGELGERIDTTGRRAPLILFNTLSWDWTAPLQLPGGAWRDDVTVPAGGWTVIELAAPATTETGELSIRADGRLLQNRFWTLELDEGGRIARLLDRRARREVLAPGALGNEWQVFEDRPYQADAWDIDFDYQDRRLPGPELLAIAVAEQGPVRVAAELTWRMPRVGGRPESSLKQKIALYANSPRIDFETEAEWHEHHQLLKAAFPVDIRATWATCQIQFGHLTRPTHRNTSWDLARFEVCAQQFVDLSEAGYGVALLNDCKYGHDILDGRIRLTCIKSAQSPDALADQGHHIFSYALLPHAGTLQEAGIVRAAAEFNVRPLSLSVPVHMGSLPAERRWVQCQAEGVIIDTLKPAEDGRGLIARLYEAHGGHAQAELVLDRAPVSVEVVNLLEEPWPNDVNLRHEGARVSLRLKPFQIVSLRIIEQ